MQTAYSIQHTKEYMPILQGVGTNLFACCNGRYMDIHRDILAGCSARVGALTISAEYAETLRKIRISTLKLLDMLIIAFNEKGRHGAEIALPISEYMRLCGKENTKPTVDKCRRVIKEDLLTLSGLSLKWSEKSRKSGAVTSYAAHIGRGTISGGDIRFSFTGDFAEYLRGAYVMQYPLALLSMDSRNAGAYHIGRKLALNAGIDANILKRKSDCLGIPSLLSVCPNIPTYERIKATDRRFTDRIKEPLENALDSLVSAGVLASWEYCRAGKQPLLESEIEVADYATFQRLYIRYEMRNAPDQSDRIKRNLAKKKRAERKAEHYRHFKRR